MGNFGIGQSIRRIEDQKFLTGTGQYTDDISTPGQAHLYLLRSQYAHAELKSIDTAAASASPGILGVYTMSDLEAGGFGNIPYEMVPPDQDGNEPTVPPHPILAKERVRYVGEPIAGVVAETLAQARDATELIEVEYGELSAVSTMPAAIMKDAPQIWAETPGNVLVHWAMGDKEKTDEVFSKAEKIVAIDLINNRISPTALEPRAAIGEYDEKSGKYTLTQGSQGSHKLKDWISGKATEIAKEKLRVVCPDVGGGFGMKNFLFNEPLVALFAAQATGRPVKWTGDRSESFLNDTHGRDQASHAELAISKDGIFLGIRISSLGNCGAYVGQFGAMIPTMAGCGMLCGAYKMQAAYVDVKVIMTNTAPTDAYRGAGRPEAAYLVERLVDKAARELGVPADQLRRKNFIPKDAFPFTTALGMPYDSGNYEELMDQALERADWNGFEQRRKTASNQGKLRGIGLSYYCEACGGGGADSAHIKFEEDGSVTMLHGMQNNGQGQETAFAQIAADTFGIPMDKITVKMGDTDEIPKGSGTGGSRAAAVGGGAVVKTIEKVLEQGKVIAANVLEAAEVDIEFDNSNFTIAGTDRSVSLREVIKASYEEATRPEGVEAGLYAAEDYAPDGMTFPNGCHICEIEIDADTGTIEFINYVIEDDMGTVLNPLMLEGQILGGAVQGLGQALYEEAVYEDGSAQLLTGSFMDYTMPRADNTPAFNFSYTEVPSPNNILGVKGAGEAGTIGSTPAVVNAIVDALSIYGVTHVDMPLNPHKIWHAINEARAA